MLPVRFLFFILPVKPALIIQASLFLEILWNPFPCSTIQHFILAVFRVRVSRIFGGYTQASADGGTKKVQDGMKQDPPRPPIKVDISAEQKPCLIILKIPSQHLVIHCPAA